MRSKTSANRTGWRRRVTNPQGMAHTIAREDQGEDTPYAYRDAYRARASARDQSQSGREHREPHAVAKRKQFGRDHSLARRRRRARASVVALRLSDRAARRERASGGALRRVPQEHATRRISRAHPDPFDRDALSP